MCLSNVLATNGDLRKMVIDNIDVIGILLALLDQVWDLPFPFVLNIIMVCFNLSQNNEVAQELD